MVIQFEKYTVFTYVQGVKLSNVGKIHIQTRNKLFFPNIFLKQLCVKVHLSVRSSTRAHQIYIQYSFKSYTYKSFERSN